MAYTPTYTDADRVKDFFKDIDAGLTDTKIDEHIQRAEGVIFATTQGNINISASDFDADNDKGHAFIQGITTKLSAFSVISYEPSNTDTNSQAALIADLIYSEIILDSRFLRDERVTNAINKK